MADRAAPPPLWLGLAGLGLAVAGVACVWARRVADLEDRESVYGLAIASALLLGAPLAVDLGVAWTVGVTHVLG